MSSLHILQGISGTGKTSFPRAFARAIGAECKVIEVQAGWRDRQDLLGHFNAFEHTFYETPFLKSLYRALCPRHKDLPYFIVLDEMNLSHPEQYFADVLSAIETEQPLKLIASPAEPAPSRMELGGQEIRIGSNIWFVGTANHDETTKEFADKTYDRSHVMELPRHRETFPQTKILQREPIALEALRTSFENARDRYQDKADVAYAFLDEYLAELLDRRFKIGWGNRLQRQMGLYIPVVLAAGGSLGEAVDHIVATKLIRKLRNRHENRSEDVRDLHNRLKEGLESLDAPWMSSSQPVISLQWLQDELHRLGKRMATERILLQPAFRHV